MLFHNVIVLSSTHILLFSLSSTLIMTSMQLIFQYILLYYYYLCSSKFIYTCTFYLFFQNTRVCLLFAFNSETIKDD
jgi:hypothetical protein